MEVRYPYLTVTEAMAIANGCLLILGTGRQGLRNISQDRSFPIIGIRISYSLILKLHMKNNKH